MMYMDKYLPTNGISNRGIIYIKKDSCNCKINNRDDRKDICQHVEYMLLSKKDILQAVERNMKDALREYLPTCEICDMTLK